LTDPSTHHWTASDGVDLAWHEVGEGSPVVLLHGLFSDAHVNWIKFGHADKLASRGLRVIMPDLRAHGQSGRPHDPANYPHGILGRDLAELITQLGLTEYALGGFSLGARTVVQGVGEGLKPTRAVLAGMGLEGLTGWLGRKHFFVDAIANFDTAARGDRHWMAIQFMKTMKVDRVAASLLLPTFTDAHPEWLAAFTMETLVLCGTEDQDNGSAPALVSALPNATLAEVPGTHMSSVTKPEFGDALAAFLAPA
jgi:pimeloyl-ACP methyl ester carboxylesterase